MVQVVPSREDAAARRVAALGGDAVQMCFPLRRQMLRKKAGAWNYALEPLFPLLRALIAESCAHFA